MQRLIKFYCFFTVISERTNLIDFIVV